MSSFVDGHYEPSRQAPVPLSKEYPDVSLCDIKNDFINSNGKYLEAQSGSFSSKIVCDEQGMLLSTKAAFPGRT